MTSICLTRRSTLILVTAAILAPVLPAFAADRPLVAVYKDPSCGCCGAWIKHIAAAGYPTSVEDTSDMAVIKNRLRVPEKLGSCHTAQVGAYVLEGHVPAAALAKLLTEKPDAIGLAVPGMPTGSPGMEVAGASPDSYDVILFARDGSTRPYMSFRGSTEVR